MKVQDEQEQEVQDEQYVDSNDFNHPNNDNELHTHWRYLHCRPMNTIISPTWKFSDMRGQTGLSNSTLISGITI